MRRKKIGKPTCAVIPGFGEKTSDPGYVAVRRELKRLGWRVVPITINWSRTTMTSWLRQAEMALDRAGHVEAIFGFSFGAMMALLLAGRKEFAAVIAASPSPYFRECLPRLPPIAEKMLGKKRMRDFAKFSMTEVNKIKSGRIEILVGSDDFPPLIAATKKLHRMIADSATLTVIPGAPHDLNDSRYLKAAMKVLRRVTRVKRGDKLA